MADVTKVDLIYSEGEKAFKDEATRRDKLTTTAEKYTAAITIIIGLKLIDYDHIIFAGASHQILSSVLAIGAYAFFAIVLVLCLLSTRIMNYDSYPRGLKLIDDLKSDSITDDKAKVDLAKMYLNARNTNANINDQRAKILSWASVCIVVGFILTIISQVVSRLMF